MSRIALLPFVALVACPKPPPAVLEPTPAEPVAERRDVVDTLHGVEVHDPYRWLEDGSADEVKTWTEAREKDFRAYTDALPVRTELYDRFQRLWRYDDQRVRSECLIGTRAIFSTKRADQDKWVVHLALGKDDAGSVIIDPNTWDPVETLAGFYVSPDCTRAVYGKARAGDENPVLTVLDLTDPAKPVPGADTFRGWKQGGVVWAHDGKGFWYNSRPLAEEKPDGGHFYYQRVWWHTLGTDASADKLVLADENTKEYFHSVDVSEDGRWQLQYQSEFNKNRLWLVDLNAKPGTAPVPLVTDLDGEYSGMVLGDKLIVTTDAGAPKRKVMWAPIATPDKAHWAELIPEGEDTLEWVGAVGGKLYAIYQHDVTTRIVVFDLDGKKLNEVPLPTLGSAGVDGWFTKPEVRVGFSSFGTPSATYTYDPAANALTLLEPSRIPIERDLLDRIVVDQAWYHSKDGTEVPMFVVHTREAVGPLPTLLTGYGGFDISLKPNFSTVYAVWLERGGVVAIPNLRGGGEFGKAWHEAGMLARKQNVFDDFIGAAEWLVAEGWTTPDKLAISGGSNGGLLVSAAVSQRPDLFRAVLCSVPLTDMVRYHTFGLANIWSEEYGSSVDPNQFPFLHAYSPYHKVAEGPTPVDFGAILVVGSMNDARTDPAHARKFFAAAQYADGDRGAVQPILLDIQSDSGHGGGVTIDTRADQMSRHHAFLMHAIGLDAGISRALEPATSAAPGAPGPAGP